MSLKRKQCMCLMLIGAIFLTVSPMVFAENTADGNEDVSQERHEKFKAKMEERINKMHEELGLSEEQKKELNSHREQQSKDREEFFNQMRAKRKELAQELQKPELNMERVNAIHSEIKDMMNKKADQKLAHILNVRKVLTPEQFSKFMGLMEKHKNHWGKKGKGNRVDHNEKGSSEGESDHVE
ncbi:MAG: periplasmic heavy metal sensor [Candidatus Omnitrophica bacterium]|nr:periplasmic heavy metal sensor [Candidatus Omnitrophota bacterium]